MIFSILLLILGASDASAAIRVVGTTPEAAWLLSRIGGDAVEVTSLARPGDNYHFLDARPDYVLAVSRAKVVCRVGAELEVGWLPKVLEKAANPTVMEGAAGDCELSKNLALLEKPARPVDRSQGDAHRAGNPHFWLSPSEMKKAALQVEEKLALADPARKSGFSARRKALDSELEELEASLTEKLKPLRGRPAYQYHRDFTYFLAAYQLGPAQSIEEIPGVSPSAARLGKVALEAKAASRALALATDRDPAALLDKFTEISGVKVARAPASLADFRAPGAYREWQERIAKALLGE